MKKLIQISAITATVMITSLVASDVLAVVDGKNITKQDAQSFVKATAPQASFKQLPANQQQMVTERLVERVLFLKASKKDEIEKSAEFEENLKKLQDELLVSLWMKKQMENAIVSDSESKDFYTKNPDKFKVPATVRARHILVPDEKTAKEVIEKLKSLKGDKLKDKFIELAKAESKGPTSTKGGDLGSFAKGQMVPEFDEAVFKLKKGEITLVPVKTQFGFHVIYLEDTQASSIVAYKDVKDKIVQSLKQKQFQEKLTEVAKELKSKAKITYTAVPKVEEKQK
ncbi:MAG: peptidylprolyl isomerase [Sulfurovum sp.]|nr:peptidylprolyl isomerase [Sulfurovaceae bacterium]